MGRTGTSAGKKKVMCRVGGGEYFLLFCVARCGVRFSFEQFFFFCRLARPTNLHPQQTSGYVSVLTAVRCIIVVPGPIVSLSKALICFYFVILLIGEYCAATYFFPSNAAFEIISWFFPLHVSFSSCYDLCYWNVNVELHVDARLFVDARLLVVVTMFKIRQFSW